MLLSAARASPAPLPMMGETIGGATGMGSFEKNEKDRGDHQAVQAR
jgi:hypothetical protein